MIVDLWVPTRARTLPPRSTIPGTVVFDSRHRASSGESWRILYAGLPPHAVSSASPTRPSSGSTWSDISSFRILLNMRQAVL